VARRLGGRREPSPRRPVTASDPASATRLILPVWPWPESSAPPADPARAPVPVYSSCSMGNTSELTGAGVIAQELARGCHSLARGAGGWSSWRLTADVYSSSVDLAALFGRLPRPVFSRAGTTRACAGSRARGPSASGATPRVRRCVLWQCRGAWASTLLPSEGSGHPRRHRAAATVTSHAPVGRSAARGRNQLAIDAL
jgi:hypothetical protein